MIFTLTDRNYEPLDVYETDDYLIGQYTDSILETLDINILADDFSAVWARGNYIMCQPADGKPRWFTIIDDEDGLNNDVKSLVCYSGTLDIIAEEYPGISATQAQPFEWYFNKLFYDTGIVLGINELDGQSRKLEYTSQNATNAEMLQYVLNGFDNAEASLDVEFDGTTPTKIVLNVYKRIGETEPQTVLSDEDDSLTDLTRKGSLGSLGTSLLCFGAEENETKISLTGKEYSEKDDDGNILYYSPKDSPRIFAVKAHEDFYVQLPGKANGEFDGYINRTYTSDSKTQDALWTAGLGQLKKIDHAIVEYEAKGLIDCRIGDNVQIISHTMQPPVMISARVVEYKFNDDDPTRNEYKFSNYVELESNMDDLSAIIADIKKNIVYILSTVVDYQVSNQGATVPTGDWVDDLPTTQPGQWLWTRTTQSMSNGQDVVSYGKSYNGTNGGQGDKGDDGKTSYVHTAYLMADGTFTKVLPGENLVLGSNSTQKDGIFTNFDSVNDEYAELTVSSKKVYKFVGIENGFAMRPTDFDPNKTYTWSFEYMYTAWNFPSTAKIKEFWIGSRYSQPPNWQPITQVDMPWKNGQGDNKLNTWYKFTASVKPSPVLDGVKAAESIQLYYPNADIEGSFTLRIKKGSFKLEEGSTATPYTPSPQDDPINAYPAKEGTYSDFNAEGSDNPDDYTWKPFRGVPGVDGYTPVKDVDYFDGKPGQDGKSSRLWIKYSQKADGNPMTDDPTNAIYTGYATTLTDTAPTDYKAYKWQQTRGKDGEGIPGEPGADGSTSYLHIKYSNDGGKTFTGNSGEDVGAWIGQYVDFTKADSAKVADYTWNKVVGDDGKDGVGVKSTTVTYQSSTSGTVTPIGTWSSTIPDVSKGNYLWTKTVWTYTDNTTKLGYSVSYVPKDGEPGAPGKDGAENATFTFVQTATPSTPKPKKGDLWWVGSDVTSATALRLYDGSEWNDQTIQQAVLNIKELNAITLNTATLNGSQFINSFDVEIGSAGSGIYRKGTTTIYGGQVLIHYQQYVKSTGAIQFVGYNVVDPEGMLMVTHDKDDPGTVLTYMQLTASQLAMTDYSSGFSGVLSSAMLTETQWTNITLDSGYQVSENNPPQFRMVYNVDGTRTIKFRGQVTTTNAAAEKDCFFSKNKDYYFGRVPTAFKPPKNKFGRAESGRTNMTGGRLTVQASDGRIIVNFPLQDVNYAILDGLSYDL